MVKRVAIVGTYMWTPRIAESLKKYTGVVCTPVSEVKPRDALRLLGVLGADVTMRIGFRPGQVRPRGIVLDLVCLFYILAGGKLVFYWTGSDVPRTIQSLADRSLVSRLWSLPVTRLLLRKSEHCVAAPWLVNELESMGCTAENFPVPTPTEGFESASELSLGSWPDQFTVLSYVPDHNYQNYCGDEIVELATRMPHVRFRVMGGDGDWCKKKPDNLEFLGWTDALEEYRRCVVLLRAVRHDALGGTVREALLCGRYVLYTYPHECAELLPDPDVYTSFVAVTEERLMELLELYQAGQLRVNKQGYEWVRANLSEKVLAINLANRWFETRHE
tara:strand:- start:12125 stop:13120 length:996 start_codon:yes stop_codon:yes gene_type:complete